MGSNKSGDALYGGTVRVVTEQDLKNDSRLVAASAVVGQLYDFDNLQHIPEGAAEKNVDTLNETKDINEEATRKTIEDDPEHREAPGMVYKGREPRTKEGSRESSREESRSTSRDRKPLVSKPVKTVKVK